jgi:hypothetical protein
MAVQDFHLGDILSITTGRLVSLRHMSGVYGILNFMTQDDLYTHQLIIAGPIMKDPIFEQHPWLQEVVVADDFEFTNDHHVYTWLDDMINLYGQYHPLKSREDLWQEHDMMEDLIKIMSGEYKPGDK